MSTSPADAASAPLQFDAAVPAASTPAADAAPCAQCAAPIDATYYTIGGAVVCPSCRQSAESHREKGTSAGRFSRALLFGLGGAIAGALLYFTVLAVTGYEIGLIAIAVGWLVGVGVSRGSRGRGGRRYQILAVTLAYLAIDATYLGYLIKGVADGSVTATADSTAVARDSASAPTAAARDSAAAGAPAPAAPGLGATDAAMLAGVVLGLPIIANLSNMPGGLIGLLIIFFALSQAWRMNAAVALAFEGPFRVGPRGPDAEPMPAGA